MHDCSQDDHRFNHIGKRLRDTRRRHAIDVADLASRSGVSKETIRQIETGNTEQYLSQCLVLAVDLGLAFEELFEGEPNCGDLAEAAGRVLANGRKWTVL